MLPFGVLAGEVSANDISAEIAGKVVYDVDNIKTYQVEGHSMEHLGFGHDVLIDVVPASDFNVGDVIAFECFHSKCDGAYIKKVTDKKETCLWVEGRYDIWEEDGKRKQSMDSRTTYGWLCDDDIDVYGVAFIQKA